MDQKRIRLLRWIVFSVCLILLFPLVWPIVFAMGAPGNDRSRFRDVPLDLIGLVLNFAILSVASRVKSTLLKEGKIDLKTRAGVAFILALNAGVMTERLLQQSGLGWIGFFQGLDAEVFFFRLDLVTIALAVAALLVKPQMLTTKKKKRR